MILSLGHPSLQEGRLHLEATLALNALVLASAPRLEWLGMALPCGLAPQLGR